MVTAQGTPHEVWTATSYHDLGRYIAAKSDLETKGDGIKVQARGLTDYNKTTLVGRTYHLTPDPFRAATSSPAPASCKETMGWALSTALATVAVTPRSKTFAGARLPAVFGGSNTAFPGW
ncbi:MAG: hypothetical protein ABI999_08465 [Acidobacteriota bacterium]